MKRKQYVFTNSAGDTFALSPLNPLEEQLVRSQLEIDWVRDGKTLPKPPEYEATNAAGEKFLIALKDEREADTEELKSAWAKYKEDQQAIETEYSERFLLSCFSCVEDDPDKYPVWKKRMTMRKIPIPIDEVEKQILFSKTWVIRSVDDISALIIACTRTMTNISDEAANAAEAAFRSYVEGAAATVSEAR